MEQRIIEPKVLGTEIAYGRKPWRESSVKISDSSAGED
jgi:hypothetical protein